MQKIPFTRELMLVAFAFTAPGCGSGKMNETILPPIYVDSRAVGIADGSSWVNAYATIQQAVDAAHTGQHIWVATGNGYRATDEGEPVIRLRSGISVFGGFHANEMSPAERSADQWTRISGDRTGNGPSGDDSCHVVVGAAGALLDRFLIVGGNANCVDGSDVNGGGVFNEAELFTINNVFVAGNRATGNGGGIYNTGSIVLANASVFANTSQENGGGVYTSGEIKISTATFAVNNASSGGGIYNSGAAQVTTALWQRNRASENGGAMYDQGSLSIANATIVGNTASHGGGIFFEGASSRLTSVSFAANDAVLVESEQPSAGDGGGMRVSGASAIQLSNAVLWGNSGVGSGVFLGLSSELEVASVCSQQNLDGEFDGGDGPMAGSVRTNTTVIDPFDQPYDSEELFLNPNVSGCIDQGDNEIADRELVGIDWRNLTTRSDGQTDTEVHGASGQVVDVGRYYHARQPHIVSLSADTTTLHWTTEAATTCMIRGQSGTLIQIPTSDISAGSLLHEQSEQAQVILVCLGAVGSSTIAIATVPLAE